MGCQGTQAEKQAATISIILMHDESDISTLQNGVAMNHRVKRYKNIVGVVFGLVAGVLAIIFVPALLAPQNGIAQLDKDLIRDVWFDSSGKPESDIVWLDKSQIEPLYNLFSSGTVERAPAKWIVIGRVGFTYGNGQNDAVDLYDTGEEFGAFRSGDTYFRYRGGIPEVIKNAQNK